MKATVKFWYSKRDFDSCSKGEIKFENGSVIRVNVPPRIKISVPKLNEDTTIGIDTFSKMDRIISKNIYKYTKESTSHDQFEHGIQALFNIMINCKNVAEAIEAIKNFEVV